MTSPAARVYELEDRLRDLRTQRMILEASSKERLALVAQLSERHRETLRQSVRSLEEENLLAAQRNARLLEDVLLAAHRGAASPSLSPSPSAQGSVSPRDRLLTAKRSFLGKLEQSLPLFHRGETARLEERARAMKRERLLAEQRRVRLSAELARSQRAHSTLESERRGVLSTLAEEQRDLLNARVQSLVMCEQARVNDDALVREVLTQAVIPVTETTQHTSITHTINRPVITHPPRTARSDALVVSHTMPPHKDLSSTQRLKDYSESESESERESDKILAIQPQHSNNNRYKEREREEEQERERERERERDESRSLVVRSSHNESEDEKEDEKQQDTSQHTTVRDTIADTQRSQISKPDQSPQQTFSHTRSQSFTHAQNTSLDQSAISHKTSNTLTPSSLPRKNSEREPSNISQQSLPHIQSFQAEPPTQTQATPQTKNEESDEFDFNSSAGSHNQVHTAQLPPQISQPHAMLSHNESFSFKQIAESDRESETSQRTDTRSATVRDRDTLANTSNYSSRDTSHISLTQTSFVVSEDSLRARVASFPLPEAQSLFLRLVRAIERRVCEEREPVSKVYTESATPAQRVTALQNLLSEDDEENNAIKSAEGLAALELLSCLSDTLVVRDAFTGLVKEDKFRRDLRKSDTVGLTQFWDAIFAHVKTLSQNIDSDDVDVCVQFVANALTHSLRGEEKSRINRKISGLLQQIAKDSAQQQNTKITAKPNQWQQAPFLPPRAPTASALEFQDDEIFEDEEIVRPPALRDLDLETPKPPQPKVATVGVDDDEFDIY